jgi:hypothetical protein
MPNVAGVQALCLCGALLKPGVNRVIELISPSIQSGKIRQSSATATTIQPTTRQAPTHRQTPLVKHFPPLTYT